MIPKSLSLNDFKAKINPIKSAATKIQLSEIELSNLHGLIIERLGNVDIKDYPQFLDHCGNLGNIFYHDLYVKLYPENQKQGGRKSRRVKKHRLTRKKN